jgi:PTS system N-acetylgalactosamine-specific IIA component
MSSVRALVAGHGTFAAGMLSAVEQITGRTDLFLGVTNHDLSAADVEALMRERLDSSGATVIFTDLPAGSCTMAARRIQRERPDLAWLPA